MIFGTFIIEIEPTIRQYFDHGRLTGKRGIEVWYTSAENKILNLSVQLQIHSIRFIKTWNNQQDLASDLIVGWTKMKNQLVANSIFFQMKLKKKGFQRSNKNRNQDKGRYKGKNQKNWSQTFSKMIFKNQTACNRWCCIWIFNVDWYSVLLTENKPH